MEKVKPIIENTGKIIQACGSEKNPIFLLDTLFSGTPSKR